MTIGTKMIISRQLVRNGKPVMEHHSSKNLLEHRFILTLAETKIRSIDKHESLISFVARGKELIARGISCFRYCEVWRLGENN